MFEGLVPVSVGTVVYDTNPDVMLVRVQIGGIEVDLSDEQAREVAEWLLRAASHVGFNSRIPAIFTASFGGN